jgi:hypothetical protein
MQNESRIIYVSEDKRRHIQFLEILERYDFQKEVGAIRSKWNIDTKKLEDLDDDKVLGEWTAFIEDTGLTKEVKEMLVKLEISSVWMELILPYVLRGEAEVYEEGGTYFTEEPEGAVLQMDMSNLSNITIRLGNKFVLNDLDKVKEVLRKTGHFKTTRREDNEYGNRKRDKKIFEMAEKGKTIVQINEELKKKYGYKLEQATVRNIHKKYCNRLRIPKGKRPVLKTGRTTLNRF